MSNEITTNDLSIEDLIKSTSYGGAALPPADSDFDFEEDQIEGVRLPYPKTLQKTSKWGKAKDLGKIFVSNNAAEESEREDTMLDGPMPFILVDVLTDTEGRNRYGARILKNPDQDAEEWMLCSSPNGRAPYHSFINETVPYPKATNGASYVIGQDVYGKWIENGEVCKSCPFASWDLAKQLGLKAPPCVEGYQYILWNPQFGLMKMNTPNLSMHFALLGNKKAYTADNEKLVGIAHYFKRNDTPIKKTVKAKDLTEDHLPWVTAVENEHGVIELDKNLILQNEPDKVLTILQGNYKTIHIEIPTFPFAPQGLPSPINPDVPVYKVMLNVEENNNTNSAFVWHFTLSEDQWSKEDWDTFTQEKAMYKDEDYRQKFMRTEEYVEAAKEKIASLNITVLPPAPQSAQLPAGDTPPWAADVIEGDVEEDDYEL